VFRRVAVIGVGLIGGSFALALKQAKACAHVLGVGRSRANLELARERGIIDSIEAEPAQAVRGADLVLVATPVGQMPRIFEHIRAGLDAHCVVMDAGSTKRDVVAAARSALRDKAAQFIPAHPIAGAEKSGAGAAQPELFRGKRVVLTPLAETSPAALERASAAWSACGARLSSMEPEEHDAVLAAVSHLPHVLAFALVHDVATRENAAQLFAYAAGGFRDFTRIASSDPEMWRDICVANRDRLFAEIAVFERKLHALKQTIGAADAPSLQTLFAEARAARERWLEGDFDS
jgi:prephenate dehydrogenase